MNGGDKNRKHYIECINCFIICLSDKHVLNNNDHKWATSQQNLSSGFPSKQDSNQSPQLQRLARKLKFRS